MDGQWSIILSEHIWLFVHSFCFRSRSDEWCAIKPRGEGLGGGVRGQGGAQGAKGASNTLSAADAGHRRHIIARGLIALLEAIVSPPNRQHASLMSSTTSGIADSGVKGGGPPPQTQRERSFTMGRPCATQRGP